MTKAAEILRTLATCRSAEYCGWQELPLMTLKRRGHARYTRKWSWPLKRMQLIAEITPEGRAHELAKQAQRMGQR